MTAPVDPSLIPEAADRLTRLIMAAPSVIPGVGELAGVVDSMLAVRRWISDRHNWVRVVWVVGGFSLMVTGAMLMARRPIESAATRVGGEVISSAVGKA